MAPKSATSICARARSASRWCSRKASCCFRCASGNTCCRGAIPTASGCGLNPTKIACCRANALAQVGADALRDRWMDQLSGGEKQRVILARALAQQPSLLLLDEPTQHLDIGGKVELLRRLRRLADENRYTVLVVTHELNLAAEFSDRIVLLHKGKCLRVGTPAEVYERELLEEVFEAPLEVEIRPGGRPRVILRGNY